VTPHAFIRSAKLDRACALLHQPAGRKNSVAGIARQCGFADPAHFSRAFHARHGVAPTAWRDQVQ
jgi:AraC family transcriptional regulator, positive regulator of tynA and feaB